MVLEILGLSAAALANGRFLFHIFQLESYQLPGYFRSLRRNPTSTALPPLSVSAIGIAALVLHVPRVLCLLLALSLSVFLYLKQKNRKAKKPFVITERVKRLAAIHFIVTVILLVPLLSFSPILAYLLPGLECLVLALASLAAAPVEAHIAGTFVKDARNKLNSRPDLICIGITGSYGKTSTKFLLRDILSIKYRVLATPGSFNTTMGVTRVIREELMPSHQVFIAEMGARHVGDIRELCELVQPQIGILTSVGPQHLDTFGTVERVTETKYELIKGLPPEGTAIFARDGGICEQLYERCPLKKKYMPGQLMDAEDISSGPWGTRFTLVDHETGEHIFCETRLLGEYAISNLLLCATAAKQLGMTAEEIAVGIRRCKPVEHRLQLLSGGGGITIIDDAFNSNPKGASAALHVLRDFPGRRIIVTPGMVELGEQEAELNRAFGREMASCVDYAYLVGRRHSEPIAEGLTEAGFPESRITIVGSLAESTALLNARMQSGDVILYENDLPDNYSES